MINRTAPNGIPASIIADAGPALPFHFESDVDVNAPADAVFALLDDHSRLSAHMTQPTWMMAGSVMTLTFDAAGGRAVGAKINLQGRVLGIPLLVEEIVTERNPPQRKVWTTIGRTQLVVIGSYRMGFEIVPNTQSSHLRVFIDYAHPDGYFTYWLGRLLGATYARWCTQRMTGDAVTHFRKPA